MRLYHTTTLKILAKRKDIPKRYSITPWCESFKFIASGKSHPKMFLDNYELGLYLRYCAHYAIKKGCKPDTSLIHKLPQDVIEGYCDDTAFDGIPIFLMDHFDDNYLFSDACSLYFKGVNIFPDIFGDKWRKYVPVESLLEIKRQIEKTL